MAGRKPFIGVAHIVRFNWHFYALALTITCLLVLLIGRFGDGIDHLIYLAIVLVLAPALVSLIVSYYVYDLSGLYQLDWLKLPHGNVINIHAGFDEISQLIKSKYPFVHLSVCDFYDPVKHTEVSIKRARSVYPAYPGTIPVNTGKLPFADSYANAITVIFAAHEIRNEAERISFFIELARVAMPQAEIIIVEHLRDTANFLAYNIGFVHFHSKSTWLHTFASSGFIVKRQFKITSFVTTFILCKNDIAT